MIKTKLFYLISTIILVFSYACSSSSVTSIPEEQIPSTPVSSTLPSESIITAVPTTGDASAVPMVPMTGDASAVPMVAHIMIPADTLPVSGNWIGDVDSSGTGTEKRAPYGDSYKLNRFERPFLQDMSYVPDMDIKNYNLSQDSDWYYITIELIGSDPNNPIGINYGIEFDLNLDGFGDYILWAHPPYTDQWDTSVIKVFKDTDQDTGGLSGIAADVNFGGTGYDSLFFDGGTGQNPDPDLAWVRIVADQTATVQFAVKKSLVGSIFMMGVVSDAGLKDVSKLDYNDHFTEAEAGSPVLGKPNYPLGTLYAVDNTCWEVYGTQATGYEPKVCPPILQTVNKPSNNNGEASDSGQSSQPPLSCDPEPICGPLGYDPDTCDCLFAD